MIGLVGLSALGLGILLGAIHYFSEDIVLAEGRMRCRVVSFAAGISIAVALEKDGQVSRRFSVGDAIDLRVSLDDGYEKGDLLWVCLPDSLSRILGGGQVKRFSVDFRERDQLRVPLVVTAPTVDESGRTAPQHFAACVRNMFEEERTASPGKLMVMVSPR